MNNPVNKFQRGSEWRKWDLHVHTPASANFSGTYEQIIQQIESADCEVVGINDYCTISGYREILQRKPEINKVLLPVVEFRMTNILTDRRNPESGQRINFHIIFNPYLRGNESKDLTPIIDNFIKSVSYRAGSGNEVHIGDISPDEPKKLYEEVSVNYFELIEKLEKHEELKSNYLIILPYQGYGGIDGIDPKTSLFKPALINKAHLIETSNKKQIEFFLWEDKRFTEKQYAEWFKARKPSIKGSDSHSYEYPIGKLKDENSQPIDKYCWIKADPTFEGLKQVVREPKDRIWIGEMPSQLELVDKNQTKYIDRLTIDKVNGSSLTDIWFNNSLEFNTGLIAIIGNKGKGKSALAETIGLLGYTRNSDQFSFLKLDKFKKNKLASNFEANIKWKDGQVYRKNLHDDLDLSKPERIKCIPQRYLETICNNLDRKFQDEIDNVVFSHIDESEKLEKEKLGDLIQYKTQTIEENIVEIRGKIVITNAEIISTDRELSPEHLRSLEEEFQLALEEAKSQFRIKPKEEQKPEASPDIQQQQQELYRKLGEKNTLIKKLEKDIENTKEEISQINQKVERIKIAKGKIEAFRTRYKELSNEFDEELMDLLGVELKDIISFNVDFKVIDHKLKELGDRKLKLEILIKKMISPDEKNEEEQIRLYSKLKKVKDEKEKIQSKLHEPAKLYQKYLESLILWKGEFSKKNKRKKEIRRRIKFSENKLPAIKCELEEQRLIYVAELHQLFEEKVKIYKELYKPVIEFIEKEREQNPYMELNFSAEIMLSSKFEGKFFSFIDRGRKGTFQGVTESPKILREIIDRYDYAKVEDIIQFLLELKSKLQHEIIEGKKVSRKIEDQLVKNVEIQDIYDYLFPLEFLRIDYRLKWGDKLLEDLSPGERGAVLLIFYLLIDQSGIPLIIDQPEENLDNESVYNLLVGYIKRAKKRRQVFIVTHNPNLAVVCDAEQIIYCDLYKKHSNKISYLMGSIEEPIIKKKIIDVLEGTKPAFKNRQGKYDLKV